MDLLQMIRTEVPAALLARRDTQAIADFLSTDRTVPRRVPIADIQAQLQASGSWWAIKAAAKDPDHIAWAAADAVMDVANSRYDNVDLSLPKVQEMFGALQAVGLLPASDLDAINAMGRVPFTVTEYQVRCACFADNGDWIP